MHSNVQSLENLEQLVGAPQEGCNGFEMFTDFYNFVENFSPPSRLPLAMPLRMCPKVVFYKACLQGILEQPQKQDIFLGDH